MKFGWRFRCRCRRRGLSSLFIYILKVFKDSAFTLKRMQSSKLGT